MKPWHVAAVLIALHQSESSGSEGNLHVTTSAREDTGSPRTAAASKPCYVIGLRGAVWDFVLHGYTLDLRFSPRLVFPSLKGNSADFTREVQF